MTAEVIELRARCEGHAIAMDAVGVGVGHRTWNQVTRAGSYKGHAAGAFAFDERTHAEIVANFRATANGRIPVDYEHLSEIVPDSAAVTGVPAVAWVVDLMMRGADLWALFEWVDARAVEMVRAGQYLYLSPCVIFNARDRVTGETIGARLTSVALTNHPFLDGMAAVAASETARPPLTALPDSVTVSPDRVSAADATKGNPMTDDDIKALRAEAEKHRAAMSALVKLAGVSPDASADAALASIVAKLSELDAMKADHAGREADRVIASGRVAAAAREHLVKLALTQRETFSALYPIESVKAPTADAFVMSQRLAPSGGHAPERDVVEYDSHADAADAEAQRIMSTDSTITYEKALLRASRDLRDCAISQLRIVNGGAR